MRETHAIRRHLGQPALSLSGGAPALLEAFGHSVAVQEVGTPQQFGDTASSSARENRALARLVGRSLSAGGLPVVLTGSCVSSHGVVGGYDHAGWGVVWMDAHGDFNTPDTTESGFFPGMSLSVLTAHCYRDYWAQIGDATPIPEVAVVLVGVRDLSPAAERHRLDRSSIRVVNWANGNPADDVDAALNGLAVHVEDIYLHVDLDCFDPSVASGVGHAPVRGGLSRRDGTHIIRTLASSVRAVTIATYIPEHDEDGSTLALVLDLIEELGRSLRPGHPNQTEGLPI